MSSTSLYAAIDLGSNSFHMLVVREVAGSIQTLSRIKRKVRLAAGLNSDNALSAEAMERGWQCLRLFAERLQDIPRRKSASSRPRRCVWRLMPMSFWLRPEIFSAARCRSLAARKKRA